jgi:hypothetical protein
MGSGRENTGYTELCIVHFFSASPKTDSAIPENHNHPSEWQ